jgi:dihydrofolate synthase/folylpolyglutamate synthase
VGSLSLPGTLSCWLELLESRHPKLIDLGLERCEAVWERMGSPQPAARIFVVAGTNGKGSTVSTLCALLKALGLQHGSYTSPHIEHYNERVRLNGEPVSDVTLLDSFARIEEVRGDSSLSYFEFGTLAAIDILSRAGLDFAVMEVGLGGRLDAVNILDADCAVITPIGLDHQDYLGNDRHSIGREKAGIIRAGRPVICGDLSPPASIIEVANTNNAPLKQLGRDFMIHESGGHAHFSMDGLEMDVPLPVLAGKHQLNNMATALAALFELIPVATSMPAELGQGLRQVSLHGRFEQVQRSPVIWLDVGHNPLAARVVAGAVADAMQQDGMGRCRCVLGMLEDKDAAAVVEALDSVISSWYCAGIGSERGQSGTALAEKIGQPEKAPDLRVFDRVGAALDAAMTDSSSTDAILVFGSFLTVTDAMRHLRTDTARIPTEGQG